MGQIKRDKISAVLVVMCAIAQILLVTIANSSASAREETLYHRLGGYDAIAAVTLDLVARLAKDPQLKRFWENRGEDGVAREKQLVIDYIVARAGGPLNYSGRALKVSHKGMKISEQDWSTFQKHLNDTLDKFKLPTRERIEVVNFLESTKKDILD